MRPRPSRPTGTASRPDRAEQSSCSSDDYWNDETAGCKTLIDGLDRQRYQVEHLLPVDRFLREWGTQEISMVKVVLAPAHS
jgi:hypothetical protein